MAGRIIILDTGPLGKVTNPKSSPENDAAAEWLQAHLTAGSRIFVPEIANYELRRELILGNKLRGLAKLDSLIALLNYLPLSTQMIYDAAELWASARKSGMPTASRDSLDADMLLVAQARSLRDPEVVIATVDVGDLPRFVLAKLWNTILPEA